PCRYLALPMSRRRPTLPLFPYTTLFRSADETGNELVGGLIVEFERLPHLLHQSVLHHDHAIAQRHGLDLIVGDVDGGGAEAQMRSEEHTSELQSREKLVCRLLLEKKNAE